MPPRLSDNGGFSLIEMLVVVAIMAMLAQVATINYKRMVVNAKRAEAHKNAHSAYALHSAFVGDFTCQSESAFRSLWQKWDTDPSGPINTVGYYIKASPTLPCNYVNPTGFQIPECDKARYWYWVTTRTSGPSGCVPEMFEVQARSRLNLAGPDHNWGEDMFAINACNRACQRRYVNLDSPGSPIAGNCPGYTWNCR